MMMRKKSRSGVSAGRLFRLIHYLFFYLFFFFHSLPNRRMALRAHVPVSNALHQKSVWGVG